MPIEQDYRCPVAEAGGLRDVDGRRWCDTCSRVVHDLSEATEAEAHARLEADGGTTCATVRTDTLGRVRFRAAATLLAAACGGTPAPPEPEPVPILQPVAELPLPPPARPDGGGRGSDLDGLTTGIMVRREPVRREPTILPVRPASEPDAEPAVEDEPRIRVIRGSE